MLVFPAYFVTENNEQALGKILEIIKPMLQKIMKKYQECIKLLRMILGIGVVGFQFSNVKFDLLFLYSANMEKIKVHPNLYVLTIQLLARSERFAELGLFVTNKVLKSLFY